MFTSVGVDSLKAVPSVVQWAAGIGEDTPDDGEGVPVTARAFEVEAVFKAKHTKSVLNPENSLGVMLEPAFAVFYFLGRTSEWGHYDGYLSTEVVPGLGIFRLGPFGPVVGTKFHNSFHG